MACILLSQWVGTERELVMRQTMVRRHGLLSDILRAMELEVGQTLQSHDIKEVRRVVSKWETILRDMIMVKVRVK